MKCLLNNLEKNVNIAYIVFRNFKQDENVLGAGNCRIYTICNALNDKKPNKITLILQILDRYSKINAAPKLFK